MKTARPLNRQFFIVTGLLVGLYIFFYATLHQGWLSHEPHDSYTLQAVAWTQGENHLARDYEYLELAYYKNQIFVSFPPVPTLPQLLLLPFFDERIPNNLLTTFYFFAGFVFLYLMTESLFWAFLATYASGAFAISITGGVWFQAQGLNFLLCSAALFLLESGRRGSPSPEARAQSAGPVLFDFRAAGAYLFLALSVGCRPQMLFFFPFFFSFLKGRLREWLPAVCVIASLLLYNWWRFDNPLEFGHNLLTQHTQSQYGQFSFHYFYENLVNCLRLPTWEENGIRFTKFDGFNLFLSSPIFVGLLLLLLVNRPLTRASVRTLPHLFFWFGFLSVSAFVLFHKGLGGWHFGNRYFVDLIPFVTWFICCSKFFGKKKIPHRAQWALLTLGILVNWWGTYQFYTT